MLLDEWTFPDGLGGVAVWQLKESEDELLRLLSERLPLHALEALNEGLHSLHNPARRLEWLAVRVLLTECLGTDKIIAYHPTGYPYLSDHSQEISISHTKGYAALAWHPSLPVGVDIEHRSDRVMRVASRFINGKEQEMLKASSWPSPDAELLLWTVKESLYKQLRQPALDCLNELTVTLPSAVDMDSSSTSVGILTASCCQSKVESIVRYAILDNAVLSWTMPDDNESLSAPYISANRL